MICASLSVLSTPAPLAALVCGSRSVQQKAASGLARSPLAKRTQFLRRQRTGRKEPGPIGNFARTAMSKEFKMKFRFLLFCAALLAPNAAHPYPRMSCSIVYAVDGPKVLVSIDNASGRFACHFRCIAQQTNGASAQFASPTRTIVEPMSHTNKVSTWAAPLASVSNFSFSCRPIASRTGVQGNENKSEGSGLWNFGKAIGIWH